MKRSRWLWLILVIALSGCGGWSSILEYSPGRSFEPSSPQDIRYMEDLLARAWGTRNTPCYQKDETVALKRHGCVLVPGLLTALHSLRPTRRWNAAYVLSVIDDPATIPHILQNVSHPESKTRELAQNALRTMSDVTEAHSGKSPTGGIVHFTGGRRAQRGVQ